ncbi:MAG: lactate utilization protein [Acidobacteria bacterium]|nr:lactate utilization protein [Acidobacteriota bacterium]
MSAAERLLPPPLESVMPVIPAEELLERFEAELRELGCNAYRASSLSTLEEILRPIVDRAPACPVVLSRNSLLGQLQLAAMLDRWGKKVSTWPNGASEQPEAGTYRNDCFAADVGITGADFALAETGSLVLTSFTEGSQLASLAPPIHVVLYRRCQLRGSLEEVLQNLPVSRDPDRPSPARSVVFVTGTSRTADIEQILVRGVHGPREVHAILVEEACLAG